MRLVGYIRVSTVEQADTGLGLEAQRGTIEYEAERRGWELVAIHSDSASGKSMARPGLTEALAAITAGEADGLVVAKLDRLSRSLIDFAGLMEQSRKQGWSLIALDLGVDTTTPAGEMIANVLATFAQFERRLIGQRTKEALAVRKAQGVQLGRPRTMPEDLRARLHDLREGSGDKPGMSYRAIANLLNEEGTKTVQDGRAWYPSTIQKALTRR